MEDSFIRTGTYQLMYTDVFNLQRFDDHMVLEIGYTRWEDDGKTRSVIFGNGFAMPFDVARRLVNILINQLDKVEKK